MEEDGETAEFLTDDNIAAAVTQEPMEEEGSDDETQCDKKDVVPHADGAAALDYALRYLEQQPDTTPADVLFMRCWRNYASSKRLSSLRQKKITELMRKTDIFPEADTTMSYSGFEPEPTRLRADDHSHHTGWAADSAFHSFNRVDK
ncbi:hypothetical protein TNCV_3705791 [Trichonephila clavipes]|nr:hypothetical protein TNCV_3705791 [Trichonephila clavipes]